jgi:uncharacterized membrane protein
MSSTLGLDDRSRAPLNPAYQLDVGRVVSQSISITLNNLPSFGLVGLICYLPVLFVQAILAVAPPPADAAIWLNLAVSLAQGLSALVLTGALTFGVMRHLAGDKASAGEIVQAGLSSLGRVFVVSLMVGILTMIGIVLCVVPGVIVMCMNWVAVPVAVMEEPGATASMTRSQELTAGTRLSVFAVILLIGMIYGVVSMVGGVAVVGVAGATESAGLRGAATLALTVLLIPFECLKAASAAVGYHELRMNREGVGLDELVRVFE